MRNVNPAVSIGMSVVLVLGLVQAPAAQTLESEARRALARQGDPAITHDEVRAFLRSRDKFVRDRDRDRRLAENREEFARAVNRVGLAAATGRLDSENARFEEANRRLEKEIAAARERQQLRVVRTFIRIPVTIIVTVATQNPIVGAAAGSAFSTAVTGGDLDEVVTATAISAATAGASELASMGIEQIATSVGEQVAAQAADELAAHGIQEAVVDKVAAEVATKVAAKVAHAMDVGLNVVATQVIPSQNSLGTLGQVLTGVNVATAVHGLLTPVVIDLEAVMELDAAVGQVASGLDALALAPDDPDAYIAALAERGKAAAVLLAANTAVCSNSLTGKKVIPADVCSNALTVTKSAVNAAAPTLTDADVALLKRIDQTLGVGDMMKYAVTVGNTPLGLATSKDAASAVTELGAATMNLDTLTIAADAIRSVDKIMACAIANDIGLHIVSNRLSGPRGQHFNALEKQWSARCAQ